MKTLSQKESTASRSIIKAKPWREIEQLREKFNEQMTDIANFLKKFSLKKSCYLYLNDFNFESSIRFSAGATAKASYVGQRICKNVTGKSEGVKFAT